MSLIYYLLVVVFAKPFQLLGSVSFDGFHRSLQSLCLRGKLVFATTTKKATTVAKNIEKNYIVVATLDRIKRNIILLLI